MTDEWTCEEHYLFLRFADSIVNDRIRNILVRCRRGRSIFSAMPMKRYVDVKRKAQRNEDTGDLIILKKKYHQQVFLLRKLMDDATLYSELILLITEILEKNNWSSRLGLTSADEYYLPSNWHKTIDLADSWLG